MVRTLTPVALALSVLITSSYAHASEFCTITPASVEIMNGPDGIAIGGASKGLVYQVLSRTEHEDKPWIQIALHSAAADPLSEGEAFVFASYLNCTAGIENASRKNHVLCIVDDPTEELLNIRADPAGDVKGTVNNGTKLRVFDVKQYSTGAWAHAYLSPYDNAAGWLPENPAICR